MDGRVLDGLNDRQREAVCHDGRPLLIVAGAGTGKTKTLVHRVAQLIERGTDPRRILLLTFSRRAAAEMLSRVEHLLRQLAAPSSGAADDGPQAVRSHGIWGGTFHAVSNRLLRVYGSAVGLGSDFTVLDRADSEDLLDVVRGELGLAKGDRRFPKKGTCMAIYSQCINTCRGLDELLGRDCPWCEEYAADLKRLFQSYVDRKATAQVLDYDDLLLFWRAMLADESVGPKVRARFDCVLVDEYQDTNRLQAEIVALLRPAGAGLTAVGDDAQSIYSWRGATVRNILDFPAQFAAATVVKLEQNYRSTPAILAATNAVIAQAKERYTKDLWSQRGAGPKPALVTCADEDEQATYLVGKILELREQGAELRKQAVLFRASHHSVLLEAELARRNIPFVKYGGLKFVEAAHVKDLLAFLRLADNPRDLVAGTRLLKLLPGIGPKKAQQLLDALVASNGDFQVWNDRSAAGEAPSWLARLAALLTRLRAQPGEALPSQVHQVRQFYAPLVEEHYDHVDARQKDLEQLEHLAARFRSRTAMLADLTLDPPNSTQDLAGEPLLDEDYLVLSTIHSAKGLEWDAVYVIHASDGNIPSDLATGDDAQIDEELRLFYVGLTRARRSLHVCFPLRYYFAGRGRSDQHSYAQVTRFLPKSIQQHFDCRAADGTVRSLDGPEPLAKSIAFDVRRQARAMWG
ncbi:MAG TPA: ATP-dependent helicase [Pirellulales bacterium]|nr:ATP-dependent helicase [Pirellulales bacterium]